MKKLSFAIVAFILIACMILPSFATVYASMPQKATDPSEQASSASSDLFAPLRNFYAPTKSSIATEDGVFSDGEYDVELEFDVNDVDGEYTDELFIDESSESFGDELSDTRSFKVYMRNAVLNPGSADTRYFSFGIEIVDVAGTDTSDRICIDILPETDGAKPFQVSVGTVDVGGVRTKEVSVTYVNDSGCYATMVLENPTAAVSETVVDGIRTTRVEFPLSSNDSDGMGLFSGIKNAVWASSVTKVHFRISGIFQNAAGRYAQRVFFGSDDENAAKVSNTFSEIKGHIINFYSGDEFDAGAANVGFHFVDGVISDGEYDVKIENITATGPYSYERNMAWHNAGSHEDNISNNFYFDYDDKYLYIGAKYYDGVRDAATTSNAFRVMGTFGIGKYVDANKPGTIGFSITKAKNAGINTGTTFLNYSESNGSYSSAALVGNAFADYCRYSEVVNADGTVTETVEACIPLSVVKAISGYDLGDEVWVRFSTEMDTAAESTCERFVVGQTASSEYTFPNTSAYWNPVAANPFKVNLSGEESDGNKYVVNDSVFEIGNAKGSAKIDGVIDGNDNYLVALEDISIDPSKKGFKYLKDYNQSSTLVSNDVASYYAAIDDGYLYLAHTTTETDSYFNLCDWYVTTPATDNVAFIRTWGSVGGDFIKVVWKSKGGEANTTAAFAEKTYTRDNSSGSYVNTQEAKISLADLKTVLGVDDLSKIQFNMRIQLDPNNNDGSGRTTFKVGAFGTEPVLTGAAASAGARLFMIDRTKTSSVCTSEDTHSYGDVVALGSGKHGKVCVYCGTVSAEADHTYSGVKMLDSYRHGKVCSACGYEGSSSDHSLTTNVSCGDETHAMKCSCGYREKVATHTLPDGNAGYSTTHPGHTEISCTASGCDYVLREKYLVSDGQLLTEYGQKWYFAGTTPPEEIGKPAIAIDGKIEAGEYNVFDGNAYFAQADRAYLALGMNADEDTVYLAIEAVNEKENAVSGGSPNTEVYIHLYPAKDGAAQTYGGTENWIELRASYIDGSFSFSSYKNGVADNSYIAEATGKVGLGYGFNGNGYDSLTFELAIDRDAILAYAKSFVNSSATSVDKLYIRAGYESIVLGEKEITDAPVIDADCNTAEVGALHSAWNDSFYNVLFLGEKADFEDYLDAPADSSRGSFYSACAEHTYGQEVAHNAKTVKQVCSECGNVVYESHTWKDYINNNDGTHTRECSDCGYKLTVAHSLVATYTDNGHKYSCVCGYATETEAHSFEVSYTNLGHNYSCDCGYSTDLVSHDLKNNYTDTTHNQVCDCGYSTLTVAHTLKAEYSEIGYKAIGCTGCDYETDKELYVPADGILLREHGQQWYFTGTKPSSAIGSVAVTVDGVANSGEYTMAAKSKTNTNSNQLSDYTILHMENDGTYLYIAYEMYDKPATSTMGADRNHHHSIGWVMFAPAVSNTLQKDVNMITLSFNNYESGATDKNISYGMRMTYNGNIVWLNTAIRSKAYTYKVLGQDNHGIDYGVGTYEFKIALSSLRTYTGGASFDRLYVRTAQGNVPAAADGVSTSSLSNLYYTPTDEVISVHGSVANGNYHAVFFGDITKHESYLKAPSDGSRGSFYYGLCEEHNFGSVMYHNANAHKQMCSDCGYVSYTAHSAVSYAPSTSTHTGICSCGYTKTEAHAYNELTDLGNGKHAYRCACGLANGSGTAHVLGEATQVDRLTHKKTCECGYEEAFDHVYVSGVCECGKTEDIKGLVEENGTWYYYADGEKVGGWVEINDAWYYFDKTTKAGAEGELEIGFVTYRFNDAKLTAGVWAKTLFGTRYYYGPDYCREGWLRIDGLDYYFEDGVVLDDGHQLVDGKWYYFAEDGKKSAATDYADGFYTDRNGYAYSRAGEALTGLQQIDGKYYYFDENGYAQNNGTYEDYLFTEDYAAHTGPYSTGVFTYYYVNGKTAARGLYKLDGDYYYVQASGRIATGGSYNVGSSFCDLPVNTYTFGADGKMLDGVVDENGTLKLYSNGNLVGKGLYEIDGAYYYAEWDGSLMVDKSQYVSASYATEEFPVGSYTFGADGKMVEGIIEKDGKLYLYIKGNLVPKGLYEIDGDYYFADWGGVLMLDQRYYVSNTYATAEIPAGSYSFGADGKMLEGVIDVDGVLKLYIKGNTVTKRLYVIDGDYYYADWGGVIILDQRYYVSPTYATEEIPAGSYSFGPDGKMVEGVVNVDGVLKLYIKGNTVSKGLFNIDGDYYYSDWGGVLILNQRYYVSDLYAIPEVPVGDYTFGADGRMLDGIINENGTLKLYQKGNTVGKGMYKLGDDYYYADWGGVLIVGQSYYVSATYAIDGFTPSNYEFGADGKLVEGIIEKNGELYCYVKGNKAPEGIIVIDGDYYYVKNDGKLVVDTTFKVEKGNGYTASLEYVFDESGKIIDIVDEFIDKINVAIPNEYTSAKAEDGTHVLDGVVGENEYDVKIENFHKENNLHTYGHNPYFKPSNGKETEATNSSWYLGHDANNLYWAVVFHDTAKADGSVLSVSRAMFDLFVGDSKHEKSFGIQLQKYSDGTIEARLNYDAACSDLEEDGALDYNLDYVTYNEMIREDGGVDEIWEVQIPFSDIATFTGIELGEEYFFRFIAEADNAYEEVSDRYQIGANVNSDAPGMTEKYWATESGCKLFKLTFDEPVLSVAQRIYDSEEEINFELPDEFTTTEAPVGIHVLDGVVGENEYGVIIKDFHVRNSIHTYGHNSDFTPENGKDSMATRSDWYLGYDADNLYWAVVFHDNAKQTTAKSVSRAMFYLFVGDPDNEKSFGVQLKRTSSGTTEATYGDDAVTATKSYSLSNVRYKEVVNADGSIDEVWEVKIPFSTVSKHVGVNNIGEEFYFKFVAEADNDWEEVCDRYQIGAAKDSETAPVLDSSKYWTAATVPVKLFKLSIDKPVELPTDEPEEDTPDEPMGDPMTFEAGYGKAVLNLLWKEEEQKLSGDNNDRPIEGVYSDLYTMCTAVRDADGNTVLMFAVDAMYLYAEVTDPIRQAISDELGIPFENILINHSHTHFAPHFLSNLSESNVERLYNGCLAAARQAIADLAPAEIYTGVIETQGLISTRRFVDLDGDGRYEPQTGGEAENPVDQNVYVINFERDGKKDIVLANLSVHTTASDGTNYEISSSFFGSARDYFENTLNTDAYLCLYQGSAGNSIPKAWVETEGPGLQGNGLIWDPYFVGSDRYGELMAIYISNCLSNNMQKHVSDKGVRGINKTLSLITDKSRNPEVDKAIEINNEWDTNGKYGNATRFNELCELYGISGTYEAYKIINCHASPEIQTMEVNAIAIGGIGIGAAGYEMLSVTGDELREQSPFDFNFVLGYTNGQHQYIANEAAFANSGYEVYTCWYVKGTAEKIRAQVVGLLETLYEAK